jgi:hypothetical protein
VNPGQFLERLILFIPASLLTLVIYFYFAIKAGAELEPTIWILALVGLLALSSAFGLWTKTTWLQRGLVLIACLLCLSAVALTPCIAFNVCP